MSTPILAFVAVCGDAEAPIYSGFGYRLDWDNCNLGDSGRRDQCYIEWRVRISGAAPTTRISATDPIDSTTVYLDADQHGAFMYYMPIDVGTYTVECRLFNSSGEHSGWQTAATVVRTARDTGKYGYYDPSVGSSGDGLSWATAKKTNAEAVTLTASLGAGCTIFCRSGTVAGDGGRPTVANVRFTKDPDAGTVTHTISANYSFVEGGGSTNGVTIDSMTFTGTDGRAYKTDVDGPLNICLYNITFGGMDDLTSASGTSRVKGVAIINCTEAASLLSYVYFSNDTEGVLVWGLIAPVGGSTEHTIRLQNPTGAILSGFHSIQYCTVGNSTVTGKGSLRWLGEQDLWCYGCVFKQWVLIGFVSPDSSSPGGTTAAFDRCRFERQTGDGNRVDVYSAWTQISFRNCYFNQMVITGFPRDSETASHYIEDIDVQQCVFAPSGSVGFRLGGTTTSALTNNPRRIRVRGCLFSLPGGMGTADTFVQIQGLATLSSDSYISNNVFERANSTDDIYRDHSAAIDYTLAEGDALASISGDVRVASMTYDATTLEPDAGLTSVTPAAPFPHVSYGGVRYDYAAANYPAGAWLSEGAAGDYPEYQYQQFTFGLLRRIA